MDATGLAKKQQESKPNTRSSIEDYVTESYGTMVWSVFYNSLIFLVSFPCPLQQCVFLCQL